MTGVPGAGPAGGRLSTDRLRSLLRRGGRWVFGDRYGLALWLGLALAFGLTWRVGFFIQDTYTTANTLVALSNGQLHVTEVRYSLSLGPLPGMHEVGGRLYGRNYGQLALALPFVWGLEAIAGVVDPGVLLPGLWALGGLAFVRTIAGLEWFDRDRTLTVGSVAVAALFVASLRAATDLDPTRLALVGYQLSTLLAAATLCLLLYRLVSLVHDRRAGLAAALVTGLATPVGFWATIPKRHTLVAAMTVGVVYAFAVSCHSEGRTALRARTGAYALAGLVTWTHAFEGFFLVVVLTGVDLLTGGSRRPRHLLLVGLVVLLALTPMLATNYAISGNPVEPPRVLPNAEATDTGGSGASGGGQADGGAASPATPRPGGGQSGPSVPTRAIGAVATLVGFVYEFAGRSVVDGLGVLGKPDRLVDIFLRSGRIDGLSYDINGYEVVELALLEAMPVAGAVAALPLLAARRVRGRAERVRSLARPWTLTPVGQTDLLVCTLAAVLTVVYLSRLPLFSQLTVRYLHPVLPLLVYAAVRLPAVRAGLDGGRRFLAVATVGWTGLVSAGMLGAITTLALAVGEAVQLHAVVALLSAAGWAVAVIARTVTPERVSGRLVAVAGTATVGVGISYVVVSAFVYFPYGRYALPVVRAVAAGLPTV
ncbi:hypothetical protein [Haloarcula pelagica]|uniref:hypothetical protein n=1 Tax=Haloarcula pelagica TaxID=3033389 RepID=UPI0024C314B1|nr:hypothetical protein [Halomicroarcula sp. YJ-61-S]